MVASVPGDEIRDNPFMNLVTTAAHREPQTKVRNERAKHQKERARATDDHGSDSEQCDTLRAATEPRYNGALSVNDYAKDKDGEWGETDEKGLGK